MLTETEKKQPSRFEKSVAQPKWKYILFKGVLGWGLPLALLLSLVKVLFGDITFNEMLRKELWINLVFFPAGGILFGLFMWRFTKRQASKLKEKQALP
ncbi:MAG: hypothetical protein ABIR30_12315 [Chitinophagaceae bacterium]